MNRYNLLVAPDSRNERGVLVIPTDGTGKRISLHRHPETARLRYCHLTLKTGVLVEGWERTPETLERTAALIHDAARSTMPEWYLGSTVLSDKPTTMFASVDLPLIIAQLVDVFGKPAGTINGGLCEEFANELVERIEGHMPYVVLDTDNFTDEACEAVDWELTDVHWGTATLTHEQMTQLQKRILCGHRWVYVDGRHYDAEAPEGVEYFWQLPFFRVPL